MNHDDEQFIQTLRSAIGKVPDAPLHRDLWPQMLTRMRPVRPRWHIWDWAAVAAAIAVAAAYPEALAFFAYGL